MVSAAVHVAPTQRAPVVTLHGGERVVEMMRWGLLPSWSVREGAKPPLMINARVKSIDSKPVFRDALARKRCLVVADGFYEWRHTGKSSEAMYFHPREPGVVAFAGLWARAKTDAGEVRSFTIVPGHADALAEPIHDRMPLMLPRDAWSAWLDLGVDADAARSLLAGASLTGWVVERVSSWVNSIEHDDPRCVEPERQQRLL